MHLRIARFFVFLKVLLTSFILRFLRIEYVEQRKHVLWLLIPCVLDWCFCRYWYLGDVLKLLSLANNYPGFSVCLPLSSLFIWINQVLLVSVMSHSGNWCESLISFLHVLHSYYLWLPVFIILYINHNIFRTLATWIRLWKIWILHNNSEVLQWRT